MTRAASRRTCASVLPSAPLRGEERRSREPGVVEARDMAALLQLEKRATPCWDATRGGDEEARAARVLRYPQARREFFPDR
ncbi:hypothetical protein MPC1_4770001 [Methylocella tundrae]|nr:hypothetical protein MPC1_4770001 [Methylocella tundrae]